LSRLESAQYNAGGGLESQTHSNGTQIVQVAVMSGQFM